MANSSSVPLREILKFPDPRLRAATAAVTAFDDELRRLVADLTETMYAARGAGLAAIQVGDLRRLFLVEATIAGGHESDPPLVFANPEIVAVEGEQEGDEGCLSFPGVFIPVKRAQRCTMRAFDADGCEFTATGEGLFARAMQHELDHVSGKLLIDHASALG